MTHNVLVGGLVTPPEVLYGGDAMTFHQLIEQGEYRSALAELQQITSQSPDPEALLSRFNMEVRLQQFDAARATAQRLSSVAPELTPVLSRFFAAAQAEEKAARRLTDPTLAGKRSAIGMPPPAALAYVKMAVHHAQRDTAGAVAALAEARQYTTPVSGTIVMLDRSEKRFTDLTDSDDLTGPTLPVYEGEHLLDLSYGDLREVAFGEPKTSFDMMWMPAQVTLVDGTVIQGRIPTLYPGTALADESYTRTGQSTEWSHDLGYAVAKGQRDLAASNADGSRSMIGIQRIAAIRFDNAPRALMPGGRPQPGGAYPQPGGMATAPAGADWTTRQTTLLAVGGGLFLFRMFAMGFFIPLLGYAGFRVLGIVIGLACCACAGWVFNERSGKTAGWIAAAVTFVFTTLKWIL